VFVFNLWVYVYGSVFLCLIGTNVFLGRFMMNMVAGLCLICGFMFMGLCFCVWSVPMCFWVDLWWTWLWVCVYG